MPPAERELSEAVPDNSLRTSFITPADKDTLRAAFENIWNDYGVQARPHRALIAHACAALISCVAQIWRGTSTVFRVHALALIAVGWFCVWLCAPARLHFVHDSSTIEIVFGVIFPLTCVPPRSLRHASPGCLGHRRAAMLDSR